jgi:hypothetical protein
LYPPDTGETTLTTKEPKLLHQVLLDYRNSLAAILTGEEFQLYGRYWDVARNGIKPELTPELLAVINKIETNVQAKALLDRYCSLLVAPLPEE